MENDHQVSSGTADSIEGLTNQNTAEMGIINFDNMYSFNYSYDINEAPTSTSNSLVKAESSAKYVAVVEEQFEMANRLKDYATVATEEIPLQLSYNIGTENIENVDGGETLIDNSRVTLEENSIITEFQNAGINLYDIEADNTQNTFNMFDNIYNNTTNKQTSSNVKIIDVQNIVAPNSLNNVEHNVQENHDSVNLDKQIYTPEAIQMSLACEEEIPSAWIDAANYTTNTGQVNIFQENVNEDPIIAVPTAIQSYINLPTGQNNVTTDDSCNNSNNDNANVNNISNNFVNMSSKEKDLLRNLTTKTDICSCKNCKSNMGGSCQNCTSSNGIINPTPSVVLPKCGNSHLNNCNCNNTNVPLSCCDQNRISNQGCYASSQKSGCCSNSTNYPQQSLPVNSNLVNILRQFQANNYESPQCSGVNTAIKMIKATNKKCSEKGDDCCVVVCLKTMDQLRHMLSLATGCNSFQSLSLGLMRSDACGVQK